MLSSILAVMGLALTASSLSSHSVGPAQPDIVTTTRFVFTCPCESTSSVSFGTSYPTSPAKVTSDGESGSLATSTITSSGTFTTQSSLSGVTTGPSADSPVSSTTGSATVTSSVSAISSAGNSAPTTGQPFGIQVSTSGTRHKRTLSSVGAIDGELVLVESELEALAFALSEEGALLIYETELAIGYSGSVGTSPLVVYPSVAALPPLMAFAVADGTVALPAATLCTTSSNVLSVNTGNTTDPSCAPVVATANTAPDAYNTAVANNVTASPLVSSNAATTASRSTSATSTSTTAQTTPTGSQQCDPNTNDGCSSSCEYCVVPTINTGGNGQHSCNSLLYCHGCSFDSDCDQYGEGFICGTYSTCGYNPRYLGTACAKADPAVCANNASLSSVISSSVSNTGHATPTVTATSLASGTVANGTTTTTMSIVTAEPIGEGVSPNGTTSAGFSPVTGFVTNATTTMTTSIVTADPTGEVSPPNGTTPAGTISNANMTPAPTSTATSNTTASLSGTTTTSANTATAPTSIATSNATATIPGTTTTTAAVCNITSLPDVTRANNETIATYSNFVKVCGKGLVEHSFVFSWEPPSYNGYNFTSAVDECIQYAVDQLDSMVAFIQSSDDEWYCVGAPSGVTNASSFVPFSGMQYAWGFEVVQTQAVLHTYQPTSTATSTSQPSSVLHGNSTTTSYLKSTTHPTATFTTHPTSTFISTCVSDQFSTCPTSTFTSQPSSIARTSQPSSKPTSQPTFTSSAPPSSTTGCNAQNLGDLTSSGGVTFQNFYSGCSSSIQGANPSGYEGLNFLTVLDFDAGSDGEHGGWTILTALSRCADNTATSNGTLFEFYVDASNNNWYCVSLVDMAAAPGIFTRDPYTLEAWGFAITNATSTSSAG